MQSENSVKLMEFVQASKAKGASDEFLTSLLIHQGWPEDEVFLTLGGYWAEATGVPLPERAGRGESSRDAFLYLLSFATLATWASALGSMLFRFIEVWFPDRVVPQQIYNLRYSVTWQMASIAVAFPIFLLVMRTIWNEVQSNAERLQSGVRKWLTYIALLLTASGVISDLICFLDYFLKGELTTPFLLKVLTVLVICVSIFVYYLGSLRWGGSIDLAQSRRRSLQFGIAAFVVVVAAFSIGMGVAGTPSRQRRLEADNRRIEDLRAISFAMQARYRRAESSPSLRRLPASIVELEANGLSKRQAVDPETKAVYEYRAVSDKDYEVCAVFDASTEENQIPQTKFWYHGKGRTCYTFDASTTNPW